MLFLNNYYKKGDMKVPVTIKIDEETRKALKEIAENEHRTLSNLISKILIDYLRKEEKQN